MSEKMNGGKVFFDTAISGGIDTVFACPGTSEMQLVKEIGLTKGLHVVSGIHENVVTGAADGYGRMKDRPSLALLHVACGLTNAMANMHNARRANAPMVVFVGGVAAYHEVNNPEHQMLYRPQQIAAATTDWAREALTGDHMGDACAEAIRVANSYPGKISLVFGPSQAMWGDANLLPVVQEGTPGRRVAQSVIDALAEDLKAGKKTALMLGGRALRAEALEIAGRIAAATGASLFHDSILSRMQRGEGRVPVQKIPYVVEDGQKALAEFEQLVLIGNQIPAPAFSYKGKALTKVPDSCEIKTLATIETDIIAALTALADAIGVPAEPMVRQDRITYDAPSGVLNPMAVDQTVANLLPEDAIVIDEGQMETFGTVEVTKGARRHDWLSGCTGGAIGNSGSIAVGAAVACPDRKVVLLSGDWSFMQTNQSLWTMAQENADICVVIMNNKGSRALEMELARVRPGDATPNMMKMLDLQNPEIDWVSMSKGLGVPATTATTAEEFYEQFEAAMNNKGPHLIDAQVESMAPVTIKMIRENLVL
ncbi:acetolactate synthase large subunit [Thermodesulfobacteriota bacterium]